MTGDRSQNNRRFESQILGKSAVPQSAAVERDAETRLKAELDRAEDHYQLREMEAVQKVLQNLKPIIEQTDSSQSPLLLARYYSLSGRTAAWLRDMEQAQKASRVAVEQYDNWFNQGNEPTPDQLNNYGIALSLSEQFQKASAVMRNAIAWKIASPDFYTYFGELSFINEKYEVAEEHLSFVVQNDPDNLRALLVLAQAKEAQGVERFEDAIADYNKLGEALHISGRYEEAIESLDKALALNPDDAWALAVKGETLRLLGHFEEAFETFSKAWAFGIGYPWVLASMGDTLRMLERTEEAVAFLDQALALDPDYEWALNSKGETLRMLGRTEIALETLDKALALNPEDSQAHARRGVTLRELGRLEESLEALKVALELNPEFVWALTNKGETLRQLGRYEEALEALDSGLALSPDDPWTFTVKGETLRQLGRYEEALEALDSGLALSPDYHWAFTLKVELLGQLELYEEAVEALEGGLALNPDDSWIWARKGDTLRLLGQNEASLEALNKALDLNPDDAWALASKGETLKMLGRYSEALQMFERALKLSPDYSQALARKGEILRILGRFPEALETLDKAVELNPDDSWALSSRGETLRMLGHYDLAVEALDKALALNPYDSGGQARLGVTLRELGRLEESLEALNKALALEPKYAWALTGKGETLRQLDRYEEALEVLDKSLKYDPHNMYTLGIKAWVFERMDDYEQALETIDQTLEFEGDTTWERAFKGSLLLYMGEYLEAERELQEATRQNSLLGWALSNLGYTYYYLALQAKCQGDREKEKDYSKKMVEALKKALKIDGEVLDWRTWLGEAQRLCGNKEKSNAEYKWVIEKAKTMELVDFREMQSVGRCYFRQQDYELAQKMMLQALAPKRTSLSSSDAVELRLFLALVILCDPRSSEDLREYSSAVDLTSGLQPKLRYGLLDRALMDLDDAIFDHGHLTDAKEYWFVKGDLLRNLERNEEAVEAFDEALTRKQDFSWALAGKGDALRMLGRNEEALEALDSALKLNPKYAWAMTSRGEVLCRLQRCDEAIESLDKVLAIAPDYIWALFTKAWALALKDDYEQALEIINHALNVNPLLKYLLAKKGLLLYAIAEYEEAERVLKRAAKQDPTDGESLAYLGHIYFVLAHRAKRQGDRENEDAYSKGMIKALKQALLVNSADLVWHTWLGEALRLIGKKEEADAEYKWVIEKVQSKEAIDSRELDALGRCYYRLNELESAEKTLEDALMERRKAPSQADVMETSMTLALVKMLRGRHAEGLEEYTEATKLISEDRPVVRRLFEFALIDLEDAVDEKNLTLDMPEVKNALDLLKEALQTANAQSERRPKTLDFMEELSS